MLWRGPWPFGALAGAALLGALVLLPASAGAEVLHSQIDSSPTDAVTSQDFEPQIDDFDILVADDFRVPAGEVWRLERVFAPGVRRLPDPGGATPASVNVFLFGAAGSLPGGQVFTASVPPGGGFPQLDLAVPGVPVLPPGTWWLGVQPRLDYAGDDRNQWDWHMNGTTSANRAALRNPGDGWETGCTTFRPIVTCVAGVGAQDLSWRIDGTRAGGEFTANAKAKRGGKLSLSVNAPNVGRLTAKSKAMKKAGADVAAPGPVTLNLKPKRKTKRTLKRGKRPKAKVKLSLPPLAGGTELATATKKRLKR